MTRRDRITELNNSLRPINKNTVKAIERNSAHYIFLKDGKGTCERCGHTWELSAKHLSESECPCCHRTFKVVSLSRRHMTETIHWESTATAIDENRIFIRYYKVERQNGAIVSSAECARYFIDFEKNITAELETNFWDYDEKSTNTNWYFTRRHYFRESGMCNSYTRNRFFCGGARPRKSFFDEVKKLKVFKYFDLESIMIDKFYVWSIGLISKKLDLYEKLQKVGMNDLVIDDLSQYWDLIKYDSTKTELTKMLGIDKPHLEMLKKSQKVESVRILQKHPQINEVEFEIARTMGGHQFNEVATTAKEIKVSTAKLGKYILAQGCSIYDFKNYLKGLLEAKYDTTNRHYTMPKDFHKEADRVQAELKRIRDEFEAKKNELIKAISDKLHEMPELQEFFKGSNGYMVTCPMSKEDFVNEGKAQSICVGNGNYADAVAKGETLVFFVRKVNDPSASFVTMEYRDGEILQCMFKYNKRVKETNAEVYDFCEAFANRLKKVAI